jgi:hypothetical protein
MKNDMSRSSEMKTLLLQWVVLCQMADGLIKEVIYLDPTSTDSTPFQIRLNALSNDVASVDRMGQPPVYIGEAFF